MRYREIGGVEGWLEAVLSGVLGNWLVGMAAFLAVRGRTIIGQYLPVFPLVTAVRQLEAHRRATLRRSA